MKRFFVVAISIAASFSAMEAQENVIKNDSLLIRQPLPENVRHILAERFPAVDSAIGSGKWVLLEFWATWCGQCKKEIPSLRELYTRYSPDTAVIFGFCADTAREIFVRAQEEGSIWKNQWPNYYLEGGMDDPLVAGLAIPGLPHPILLDGEGLVQLFWFGAKYSLEVIQSYSHPIHSIRSDSK